LSAVLVLPEPEPGVLVPSFSELQPANASSNAAAT